MHFAPIARIVGMLLMLFSITMLPPILMALYLHESILYPLFLSCCITLLTGYVLWSPFRTKNIELKSRDGFLIVVLFWTVLSLFASLPFIFATAHHISPTDAIFEAVSGLTTTGASVFTNLELLPRALLLYRQQLQFLGGMGIIVLAVAILPMLGIGGMQLYRAETPGPMKDSKLTPRITETAKALWFIYFGLIVLCAISYWAMGMTPFDAIGESFATVSTGGFNMHDSSFAYYHSFKIEIVSIIFMVLGATNFALHFMAIQRRRLTPYFKDIELRTYIIMLTLASILTTTLLLYYHDYEDLFSAIVQSVFNVVSLSTTTGFTSAPFYLWPTMLPVFIMVLAIIGGCGASTSGGLKMIRVQLMFKQSLREIKRLIHPNAIIHLRFGDFALPERLIQSIWAFIAAFIVLFIILLLAMMATGIDFETSFGSIVAGISNAGAGIGKVAKNFEGLNPTSKWIMIFAMLAGRLEIFTLLVIFTPSYWRR